MQGKNVLNSRIQREISNFTGRAENTMDTSAAAVIMGFLMKILKPRYSRFVPGGDGYETIMDEFCQAVLTLHQEGRFGLLPLGIDSANALKERIVRALSERVGYTENWFVFNGAIERAEIPTLDVFCLVLAAILDDTAYLPFYDLPNQQLLFNQDRQARILTLATTLFDEYRIGINGRCNQGARMLLVAVLSGVYPKNPNATSDSERYWYFVEEISTNVLSLVSSIIEGCVEEIAPSYITFDLGDGSQPLLLTLPDFICLIGFGLSATFNEEYPEPVCIQHLLGLCLDRLERWANEHFLSFEDISNDRVSFRGVRSYIDQGVIVSGILEQARRVVLFSAWDGLLDHAADLRPPKWLKSLRGCARIVDAVLSWVQLFSSESKPIPDETFSLITSAERIQTALSWIDWSAQEPSLTDRIALLTNFNQLLTLDPAMEYMNQVAKGLVSYREQLGPVFDTLFLLGDLEEQLGKLLGQGASIDSFWQINAALFGGLTQDLCLLIAKCKKTVPEALFWLAVYLTKENPLRKIAIDCFTDMAGASFLKNDLSSGLSFVGDSLIQAQDLAHGALLAHILSKAVSGEKYSALNFLLITMAAPAVGVLPGGQLDLPDLEMVKNILDAEVGKSSLFFKREGASFMRALLAAAMQTPIKLDERFSAVFSTLLLCNQQNELFIHELVRTLMETADASVDFSRNFLDILLLTFNCTLKRQNMPAILTLIAESKGYSLLAGLTSALADARDFEQTKEAFRQLVELGSDHILELFIRVEQLFPRDARIILCYLDQAMAGSGSVITMFAKSLVQKILAGVEDEDEQGVYAAFASVLDTVYRSSLIKQLEEDLQMEIGSASGGDQLLVDILAQAARYAKEEETKKAVHKALAFLLAQNSEDTLAIFDFLRGTEAGTAAFAGALAAVYQEHAERACGFFKQLIVINCYHVVARAFVQIARDLQRDSKKIDIVLSLLRLTKIKATTLLGELLGMIKQNQNDRIDHNVYVVSAATLVQIFALGASDNSTAFEVDRISAFNLFTRLNDDNYMVFANLLAHMAYDHPTALVEPVLAYLFTLRDGYNIFARALVTLVDLSCYDLPSVFGQLEGCTCIDRDKLNAILIQIMQRELGSIGKPSVYMAFASLCLVRMGERYNAQWTQGILSSLDQMGNLDAVMMFASALMQIRERGFENEIGVYSFYAAMLIYVNENYHEEGVVRGLKCLVDSMMGCAALVRVMLQTKRCCPECMGTICSGLGALDINSQFLALGFWQATKWHRGKYAAEVLVVLADMLVQLGTACPRLAQDTTAACLSGRNGYGMMDAVLARLVEHCAPRYISRFLVKMFVPQSKEQLESGCAFMKYFVSKAESGVMENEHELKQEIYAFMAQALVQIWHISARPMGDLFRLFASNAAVLTGVLVHMVRQGHQSDMQHFLGIIHTTWPEAEAAFEAISSQLKEDNDDASAIVRRALDEYLGNIDQSRCQII